MPRRRRRQIPYLLRDQACALGEFLQRTEVGAGIVPGGDFVVASLAGQQRPCATSAPIPKRLAVWPFAVAVVIVAAPTGAERRIDLEHGIHHAKGVPDDRVVRIADSVAHQFQKTGVHNIFRGKL
jgi:hypothetical protein